MLETGDITFKQANEWLDEAIGDDYKQNKKFYDGDHWQGGDGWLGPIPEDKREELLEQIEHIFVHKNMIAELVNRHLDAVVGREPAWSVVPVDIDDESSENDQIDAYEGLLTHWWDEQRVLEEVSSGLPSLLYARRAVWRFYISPAAIQGDDVVGSLVRVDPLEAWRYVYLESLSYTQAAVYRSKEHAQDIGLYRYLNKNDKPEVELSYVRDDGLTNISVFGEGGLVAESNLELGKRLTIFEVNRSKPFVSPAIVRNQMALNLSETMRPYNIFKTGFNELILFNAKLNGIEKEVEGRKVFIPDPILRGAGRLHNFVGVRTPEGTPASPSAFEVEPFDPSRLIASSDATKRNLYEEAKQLHAMISGDGGISEDSRIQATADFEASLRPTKAKVDALLRWVLATSLDFHLLLTGQARDDTVRVDASTRLSASVPSIQTVQTARDNANSEFWSMETALVASGIEDPGAEMERLAREREVAPREVVPGALEGENEQAGAA
jgi:hypothetical protein